MNLPKVLRYGEIQAKFPGPGILSERKFCDLVLLGDAENEFLRQSVLLIKTFFHQ